MNKSWRLGQVTETDVWVEVALLSSQQRIKVQIKSGLETGVRDTGAHVHSTQTFDSRQVNAGMLMNPNAVADYPKRALLECTWACHQLKAAKRDTKTWSETRGGISLLFKEYYEAYPVVLFNIFSFEILLLYVVQLYFVIFFPTVKICHNKI